VLDPSEDCDSLDSCAASTGGTPVSPLIRRDVDATFQVFEGFARLDRRVDVGGDEVLVAAVEGGLDGVGVFDIHAQHVGDQAAE
jgi:hypothetical protein